MKRMCLAAASLLIATMLASCMDNGPTGPRTTNQVKLELGQTVRLLVPGPRTVLTFSLLKSDSRCPMGAMCFIAGEAVVVLTISNGRQVERFQLTLIGMEGDSESSAPPVTALGHRFQLLRLDPYPQINLPVILLHTPVATVVVD